ncbi:MAG: hypothetical protein M1825_005906 [Sarcosagium campestre]|nr:MAG: hypothetical protein M1825_005906 [Sarcosagium campestre]
MATVRDGPNPLRPYYVPPSVVAQADVTSKLPTGSSTAVPPQPSFSFSDLDYGDILSDASPSAADIIKKLLDQALWKYATVLIAQPFDVAKTILQCSVVPSSKDLKPALRPSQGRPSSYRGPLYGSDEAQLSDSDGDDEPAYFTSTATPTRRGRSPPRRPAISSHASSARSATSDRAHPSKPYRLSLARPDSIVDALSQLWQKEGAWGVWKASNTTFIYSVLLRTIESWTRGLLSAIWNVPDPSVLAGVAMGGVDVADSLHPWASLTIAVAAAGIAGVLLAPLDIARTRQINHNTNISIPTHTISNITRPAHAPLPPVFNSDHNPAQHAPTPLHLQHPSIDPVQAPTSYSALTFTAATAELFIRLPLETALRRGQAAEAVKPEEKQKVDTIVDVGRWHGAGGTMWSIMSTEGQGVQGLIRGWRVGMWGLVGVWGAAALGGGATGGEF